MDTNKCPECGGELEDNGGSAKKEDLTVLCTKCDQLFDVYICPVCGGEKFEGYECKCGGY
jgi:RNA polymerase subunit RPABC4/transcription elongation factor Spt4